MTISRTLGSGSSTPVGKGSDEREWRKSRRSVRNGLATKERGHEMDAIENNTNDCDNGKK